MTQARGAGGALHGLLPIMTVVFAGYLIIGIPLPVLPLYVHEGLGLSTFVVGLVAGSQFAAAVISRMWAGHLSDSRGAKAAVVAGLLVGSASGALYLLSLRFTEAPMRAAVVLMVARALLGVAESVIITGALSWGLVLAGPRKTGTVMSWIGTALYAALAAGAPIGVLVYDRFGFAAVGLVATMLPLATLAVVVPLPRPATTAPPARPSFNSVLRAVWLPGVGLGLSGMGFAAVTTFIALLLAERGGGPVWLAYTVFSLAFIAGRATLGHLPDRLGGARVALACLVVEAAGLMAVWASARGSAVVGGVALTGLGYSLVYPGLGVEAMRDVPAHRRGVTMGAYTAFLDVSLGLGSPLLGAVAGAHGLGSVFLVSAAFVVAAAATVILLVARPSTALVMAGRTGSVRS